MAKTMLKRQFITDTVGHPADEADKLNQMGKVASDPLFMSDLRETMSAFAEADAELETPIQMMNGASCPPTTGEALI